MKLSRLLLLMIVCAAAAGAQTRTAVESSMDWTSGLFTMLAVRPLDSDMSPSDHPDALLAIEQELPFLLTSELGRLMWDSGGTLGDAMERDEQIRAAIASIPARREWSRLSADRKSTEALYTVSMNGFLPASGPPVEMPVPAGWVPLPEDAWSGIVIYAPELPVRGTEGSAPPVRALRPRIFSEDLELLFSPQNGQLVSYTTLAEWNGSPLTGRRPYRLMARELYGEVPCDIILSAEDTRRITAAPSGRQALAEGRIVIIFDGEPAA